VWDGKFIAVGAIIMPVPSAKRKFGLKLMGRAVTKISDGDPPLRAPLRGGGLFGRDLRDEPIEERKAKLARLLVDCQPALALNGCLTIRE